MSDKSESQDGIQRRRKRDLEKQKQYAAWFVNLDVVDMFRTTDAWAKLWDNVRHFNGDIAVSDVAYAWMGLICAVAMTIDDRGQMCALDDPPTGLSDREGQAFDRAAAIFRASLRNHKEAVGLLSEATKLPEEAWESVNEWLRNKLEELFDKKWDELLSHTPSLAYPTDNVPIDPDLSVWDGRRLSLKAPIGTPSPLREVYEAVAAAIYKAFNAKYRPNDQMIIFEEAISVPLSAAWRHARELLGQNKVWLRSSAQESYDMFLAALEEVARINDACGHVVLGVICKTPTAYLTEQAPFDAYTLIDRMEKATCLAAHRHSQQTEPAKDQPATIRVSGLRTYKIGNVSPILVTDSEHAIFRAFLKSPSMDEAGLRVASGYQDARRILKKLTQKYNGIFSPAIHLPGRKGAGGYHVNISN